MTSDRKWRENSAGSKALLLKSAQQLLTLRGEPSARRGTALRELGIITDGAVLCVGGKIVSVGTTKDALLDPWVKAQRAKKGKGKLTEIDCTGKVVLPGFVDSHTHPAFIQPRLIDFEKRAAGASYEEIATAGGGIRSSVAAVRDAKRSDLTSVIYAAFEQMAAQGTTTIEAKSGYGLSHESEMKSLEAIRDAGKLWPGTVVPTFLGAHVVPREFAEMGKDGSRAYVDIVCNQMLPEVSRRKLAAFVDVFCDRGAFTASETARIFAAAAANRLAVRAHLGQLSETRLAELLKFRPASFDHMDYVNDADLPRLAKSDTVASLVPGANYFLGLDRYPPARKLIEAGVAVALATDYNPGSSPTPSMSFVLSLACTHMKMLPAEAIAAATINGAHALRLADRKGSIEPGKDADLAIFDVKDYREIAYWFGVNLCSETVIGGVESQNQSPTLRH